MTRRTQKSLCLPAPAAALAIALAALVLGTWASDDQRHGDRAGQYAPTAERQQAVAADPKRGPRAGPPVHMELGADTQLDRSAQLELVVAARRFATTLAQWLYGDRREIGLAPVTPKMCQELKSAPPYVPAGEIGSGDGHAVRVRVSVQTSRSGVLTVTIRDSRTSYPIPASFERRAGRWQIVHLNTH